MNTTNDGAEMAPTTKPRTIGDALVGLRARKGKAAGIDDNGAWWHAVVPKSVCTRSWGGDGVGQSCADLRAYIGARHYRDGRLVVGVLARSWHQNSGERATWHPLRGIADATTAEDVIRALVAAMGGEFYRPAWRDDVVAWCVALGIPEAPASPDDVPETPTAEVAL